MTETPMKPEEQREHWPLIRDMATLQVKLIVDGLRDLVLVPASLIAGILSLFSNSPVEDSYFYRLICIGKHSEHWINLFGAYDNASERLKQEFEQESAGMDDVLARVEDYVVAEYHKGGVTRQAKDKIDAALRDIKDSVRRS
jgi:hypothetical protein